MEKETQDATQEEIEEGEVVTEKDKRIVEIATGQSIDWEAVKEDEKERKRLEADEAQAELDLEKDKKTKLLDSLDPVTRVKFENRFTDDEQNWIVTHSKAYNEPIKKVIVNKEVLDLIDIKRSKEIKPIPDVMEKINENAYLSGKQFKDKLTKAEE